MRHDLPSGTIHEGDWLAADLEPGYTLAILDGQYGLGKAAWDMMGLDGLAASYVPHFERVSALLAPSASLYVWNTAPGLKRLDPLIRSMGWTWRADIVWDKGVGAMAGKVDTEGMRTWYDVAEYCGFYQRGPNEMDLWNEWGEAHPVRRYLDAARVAAGLTLQDVDRALGVGGMARHYFTWSQWCLPSPERYAQLRAVIPGLDRDLGDLREEHAVLWNGYRERLEANRPAFTFPSGVTNVWSAPPVLGGERLKGPDGAALHPCQKPLLFAERMILASTRPGERVLVPFGGTCREAVVCEWLARTDPASARRYDVCELNQDGPDYIAAALAQIRGEDPRARAAGQVRMFA